MDASSGQVEMISMFTHPVFEVKDGMIIRANQSATDMQIPTNTPVADILESCKEEYNQFPGGTLSLSIKLFDTRFIVAVVRIEDCDYFHVLSETENSPLRAMALASQQLRDPLCNIMALTDALFAANESKMSKQETYKAQLDQNLHRMLRSIGNMSDAATCANRKSGMETQNICAIVSDALHTAKDLLADKNQLSITEDKTTLYSFCDQGMIERAVYNLISNAVKYSPAGSKIDAYVHCSQEKLQLTVENDCPNFNTNELGTIFFRYRRIPSVTDGGSGIGLGIPMIQAVAAAHNGSLLLTIPQTGKVRFCLTLPAQKDSRGHLHAHVIRPDYTGGYDRSLIELSDILPNSAYL